jgi:ATP phosphoribosyltransferase regulatory subunit
MTNNGNRWQLPDGVDEILPPQADQLESLRRELLDLYRSWGYDLIKTPLIEFLDSLLIVPSHELELSTFQLVDQLSGRSMGVRADISSQAARIDAHLLQKDGPVRLCYADNTLRTRPVGPLGTRCPQLIGAELYGHAGSEADIEVISLMLHTLRLSGIEQPLLALGHTAICRSLLKAAKLPAELEGKLFTAMQNKATTDIAQLLSRAKVDRKLARCLSQLPTLHGDASVLKQAARLLKDIAAPIDAALANLQEIATALGKRFEQLNLFFDLCELGGYDYHSGVIFSACASNHGEAIAKGGRYDAIGEVFGRARPATGFDADLKTLLQLSKRRFPVAEKIYAPPLEDAALDATILELRLRGQVVVQGFPTRHKGKNKLQQAAEELGCTQQLVQQQGRWLVVPLL